MAINYFFFWFGTEFPAVVGAHKSNLRRVEHGSDQDGVATLQALRPISAGDELTWSYHPDNDSPVSTLSQYGFFDAAQAG